jgi:uncharacterized repeat protein (TIGR02543 family)
MPDKNITRAEAAAIILRVHLLLSYNETNPTSTQAPTSHVCTITYNVNGGYGAPNSHSVEKNSDGIANFNLSTDEPTRSGYSFLGWQLDNNMVNEITLPGRAVEHNTGNTTGNTTLTYYAQWIKAIPASTQSIVSFSNMRAYWDTSWGDDSFVLEYSYSATQPITKYGIKCWDSKGKEISYDGSPTSKNSSDTSGNPQWHIAWAFQGLTNGGLILGEKYYWIAYVEYDGKRYESKENSFVFSAEGSRHIYSVSTVTFTNMHAYWDTGWANDGFALTFICNSPQPITEYGVKCWDSDGREMIYPPYATRTNNPPAVSASAQWSLFVVDEDGSFYGSLIPGKKYYWLGYVICNGKRYESEENSFVFSTEGSRFIKH